jgi:hypothetical protein
LNRDSGAPELETDVPSVLTSIFTPRESAQANLATRAGLEWNVSAYGLRFEYLRVEPDYETLGSYFFNTDVQSFTLAPRGSFAGGRVNVTLSGGLSRNNLYDDLERTTKRVIGSANINLMVSQAFRIGGMFSNYSADQQSEFLVDGDSTLIKNVARNYMLTPQFQFGGSTRHVIGFRASRQDYQQTGSFSSTPTDTRTTNISANYSVQLRDKDLRVRLTVSNLTSESAFSEIETRGLSFGVTKGFMDSRLNLDLRVSYRQRDPGGDRPTPSNLAADLGLNFSPTNFDSLSIRSQLANRSSSASDIEGVNDRITTFTYSRRFSI